MVEDLPSYVPFSLLLSREKAEAEGPRKEIKDSLAVRCKVAVVP